MQRAMEKHVQTLGKDIACDTSVKGVRSENHVACVCFEPHSISHLCLSYSCSLCVLRPPHQRTSFPYVSQNNMMNALAPQEAFHDFLGSTRSF